MLTPLRNTLYLEDVINRCSKLNYISLKEHRRRLLRAVATLDETATDALYFVRPEKDPAQIAHIKSSVVVCSEQHAEVLHESNAIITSLSPRLTFMRILKELEHDVYVAKSFVCSSSRVANSAVINHVGVNIGRNCRVFANAVIGKEGFGYEKDELGRWQRFPHIGTVSIGDNVEIGSNTCIDRGALSCTKIGDNVKIDNLVHIAHNAEIGHNTCIVAGAVICGSAKIGANVWIGPGAVIRDNISVGDGAYICMNATVTKNVPDGEKVRPLGL